MQTKESVAVLRDLAETHGVTFAMTPPAFGQPITVTARYGDLANRGTATERDPDLALVRALERLAWGCCVFGVAGCTQETTDAFAWARPLWDWDTPIPTFAGWPLEDGPARIVTVGAR
jgi:hypothetical protein